MALFSRGRSRPFAALLGGVLALGLLAAFDVTQAQPVAALAGQYCGPTIYKPSGLPWRCTFADDFSGPTLDRTKWVPQTVFATGDALQHACYLDDPSVISQSDGALNLTLRKVTDPVTCVFGTLAGPTNYVAGMVSTYHLFSQQYGRFEARIRNTASQYPGLQESFWLWPDDRTSSSVLPWPYSGEMDISETYSSYPNLAIPFLHYSADTFGPTDGLNTAWDCAANRGEWNTYTMVWSASRIEIFVNGKSCLVNTSGDQAFRKAYIVSLTQALGGSGNNFDGRAPLPATMNIDYVRVWS